MAEPDDGLTIALPAANPDAQTTVNDFLDYTEFYPSDLVRSLTLIGDLDSNYRDAVQQVHDLTALYGQLPSLSEHERPDPTLLRKQIAQQLQKALNQREYAHTEASRLYEVTVRHCQRSSIIKKKLQAQPEPPSRDPTPPPVSPQAHRIFNRSYERPAHLRINFDNARNDSGASRQRDRHRKPGALPRRSRPRSASSDESDGESANGLGTSSRKLKQPRDRHPKPGRVRPPGVLGTNVHSSIAGISTSNALAQLAPPPPDAQPGSRWAPWMRLTEYEMAVLRKQMKKNAVWTPSLTMVNRELERKHRTEADYKREKARCEEAGEDILDEEPESLQQIMTAATTAPVEATAPAPAAVVEPMDLIKEPTRDESGTISIRLKPAESTDGKKLDRLSQRQQAMRDALELENATSKIQQAADGLKELTFTSHSVSTPASQNRKSASRPSNKRKRDSSLDPYPEDTTDSLRDISEATQDSGAHQPVPKRPRLQLFAPEPNGAVSPGSTFASAVSTPVEYSESGEPSSSAQTPVPITESRKSSTNASSIQIPLAPAGPSTPRVNQPASEKSSQPTTPMTATSIRSRRSPVVSIPVHTPAMPPAQAVATAASSRPRRESVAPKVMSPLDPPAQALKTSKPSTPIPESEVDAPIHATRPRSARGHVPTPKAQSEEPKPNDITNAIRETRRHSIFSQSALAAPTGTRMSSRKKPPPKGEVTAAEDGQKTVTNVKRAQGSKNKRKKKAEEELEPADDIDPDEVRYCICDDVSYGEMISCDNNCDKEWFHMPCVNMTKDDIPSRRSKWYCPDCRVSLSVDAYGNPLVPPPLPGRRGNR